jgi:hypothetical protein
VSAFSVRRRPGAPCGAATIKTLAAKSARARAALAIGPRREQFVLSIASQRFLNPVCTRFATHLSTCLLPAASHSHGRGAHIHTNAA